MTEEQIIAIYCFCDDFLKSTRYQDWPNAKMMLFEIRLIYIFVIKFFYGIIERARLTLYRTGYYIKKGLSKSQLNRRLHQMADEKWH